MLIHRARVSKRKLRERKRLGTSLLHETLCSERPLTRAYKERLKADTWYSHSAQARRSENASSENMSWESWLESLVEHGRDQSGETHVNKRCIIGQDTSIWAKQDTKEDINAAEIVGFFDSFTGTQTLVFDGITYRGIRKDPEEGSMLLRSRGNGGAVMVKTNKAFVIATFDENKQGGTCFSAVDKLARQLRDCGY